MAQTEELETEPIAKLLVRYSLPAIIAMIVNSIYNVVDRIFIGNFVGEDALGGLSITFPIMMIIFAFATLIGMGGSTLLSIKLGEKDNPGANRIFGNTLALCLIISLATIITIYINIESLLILFGATAEILEYSVKYMIIILTGFIFQMVSFTLINTTRNEGAPMLSMVSMISSAAINIILDYVFIVSFGWGVQGAALATVIGQISGFAILLSFYVRKKSRLKLQMKDFIPSWAIIKEIFTIGFASFASTMGASAALVFLNRAFNEYGGSQAITSMGAINSLYFLCIMPIIGIQQGLVPIVGYNHGARLTARIWETFRLAAISSVFLSIVAFSLLELFAKNAISLFLDINSPTMVVAESGLRLYLLSLPVLSINLLGVSFFQSTAQGTKSLVLSMLRQFLFLIPLTMVLPLFWGLNGVWLATPIADILAVAVTVFALLTEYYRTKDDEARNGAKEFQTEMNR